MQVAFANSVGTAVDPPDVMCKVTDPSGAVATYTYLTDTDVLIKDSTGNYSCYVQVDMAGKWPYKWIGTDTETAIFERVAGAEEHAFVVDQSEIDGLGSSGSYGGGLDGGSP